MRNKPKMGMIKERILEKRTPAKRSSGARRTPPRPAACAGGSNPFTVLVLRAGVLEKGQLRFEGSMAELAVNETVRRDYLSV